jgi:multicomponent Na+:H+ antiporter subunit F
MTVEILLSWLEPRTITFAILFAALFIALVRLIHGPSLPDRVVALDLIAMLTVGVIAVYSITTNQPIFLDAAIVLAVIIFLGTVAFARYVEKGERGLPR